MENFKYLKLYVGEYYKTEEWSSGLFETFAFLNDYLQHPCTNRHHRHRHCLRQGNEFSHMYLNISDKFALIKSPHLRWNPEFRRFPVSRPRHYDDLPKKQYFSQRARFID